MKKKTTKIYWMNVSTLNLEWGKFSQDFFGHNLFLNKTFWLYIMFQIASLSHLSLLIVFLRKQIFFNFVNFLQKLRDKLCVYAGLFKKKEQILKI